MVNEPKELTEQEQRNRAELAYEWVARYKDGTELNQYDDTKLLVHHFGHIDQDKIYEFELVPRKNSLFPVTVNLETGLFFIDGKAFTEVFQGETRIPLGLFLSDKKVSSSWGNKAKLICFRHVRRDFVPGEQGFYMKASMVYEIGWEATVNGKHEECKLLVDEDGKLGIPATFEEQGFKRL